ncbi:MAG: hypothetical protein ACI9LT_001101 [Pseudoalteromonas distincta]|jgi:hypothetical protein
MSEAYLYLTAWALLWALLVTVCLFAFVRGGPAERIAAIFVFVIPVLSGIADAFLSEPVFLVGRLVCDGALALVFLYLAVRYGSLWLGGAMLLQALQFSLQAYYFVLGRAHDALYVTINNINFLGILACLTAGTLAASRRRRRAEAEVASAPRSAV